MSFQPTDEQSEAMRLSTLGTDLVVEALAGTGKTSTLVAMAGERPRASMLYIAFNRSIVDEASEKFPKNVECRTAHSLAMKALGRTYGRRLQGARVRSRDIARAMRLQSFTARSEFGPRYVSEEFLGGLLMQTMRNFAKSGDDLPSEFHVPFPRAAREDPVMGVLYKQFAAQLKPVLVPTWLDIQDPRGQLPWGRSDGLGFVLKIWQMQAPTLPYDVIMFDEAQDANGVMRAIVDAQTHAQRIWVGDTYQQINAWNGAINALAKVDVDNRAYLTKSFRFGPQIAEVANVPLTELGCQRPLTGAGTQGRVEVTNWPDVRLSRTNAAAVENALELLEQGYRPHIVGGADDVVRFCEGALALQEGRRTWHPELACFETWFEVMDYVARDELGGDLSALVKLVEAHGAQRILDVMANQPKEADADRILSTTHKAKGREWGSVQIAEDFPPDPGDDNAEELRLVYVAATRAKEVLDISWCLYLADSLPHLVPDSEALEIARALPTPATKGAMQ